MRRGIAVVAAGLAFSVVLPEAAAAQISREPSFAVRGVFTAGYEHFNASQTFKAVFDTPDGATYGGGADVLLPHHFFARVDAERFSRTGERAFDVNGQVFRLGLPLTVTVVPVTVSAGYRAFLARRVAWYAGAGGGSWSYTETAASSEASENTKLRASGYVVLGGVEVRLHRWVGVAFDAQHAGVPNALGKGGLSADFNEKDLGGTTARFRVIVGR